LWSHSRDKNVRLPGLVFLSHSTSWEVIIAPDITEIKKASKIIIAPEASFHSQV
jgi:hypothetical protein